MAWWELRVRVEPDEYELFAEELEGLARRVYADLPGVGLQFRPEDREVVLSAGERELLGAVLIWAFQTRPSAQISLSVRCYRTEGVLVSPWAQRCLCPPGSHVGMDAVLPGGPPLLPPGVHPTGPPPWKSPPY